MVEGYKDASDALTIISFGFFAFSELEEDEDESPLP